MIYVFVVERTSLLMSGCIRLPLFREEWSRTGAKIKYPRYNHATITVPGDMFPQCLNPQ